MGVQIAWDNGARTILRLDPVDPWRWTDVTAALDQANRMLAESGQEAVLLVDIRFSQQNLPTPALLQDLSCEVGRDHTRRLPAVIIIGAHPMTPRVYKRSPVLATVYVDTLEEARATAERLLFGAAPGIGAPRVS